MADFHALRIRDIRKETNDTVSISVDVPEHLKKIFAYKQGQYLTFRKKINGEEVRRSYSLCSSPVAESEYRIAVKKVENGRFSSFATEKLKTGDALEVFPPAGNFFTEVKEGQKKVYVAFAAGSGITPVMSILKTILFVEKESVFVLYYGNKNRQDVIFKNELDKLKDQYGQRFQLNYMFSRESVDGSFHGRITGDSCEEFHKSYQDLYKADEYFICGPEEMIFSIKNTLAEKGVNNSRIHFELFTTPVTQVAQDEGEIPDINSDVTVILDGEKFTYTLNSKGDSILDAAMNAGADVPFSCKGAVCCTCRAKLMEGKVKMTLNYSLTDQEVDDGYILTCQSHPLTGKVVVDYDAD